MTKDRILAKDIRISNDTWKTRLNNNDLIIGPSGSGKTRGYVIPNILNSEDSFVVTDTKGTLCSRYREDLEEKGYKIINIDFTNLSNSEWGYSPFDNIRIDYTTGEYREDDINRLAAIISGKTFASDPFWDIVSMEHISILLAFTMVYSTRADRLEKFLKYFTVMSELRFGELMNVLEESRPNNMAVVKYRYYKETFAAEKMHASIIATMNQSLVFLMNEGARKSLTSKKRIDLKKIGEEKTAVFIKVSDIDRSMDKMLNCFYSDVFQVLLESADDTSEGRLRIPVRIFLDDFATNYVIKDFDNIISVIRSREISVSIILQSLSQLYDMYGKYKAATIINNCDHWIYLGGQDLDTVHVISERANLQRTTIMNMPLDKAYLCRRGSKPILTELY